MFLFAIFLLAWILLFDALLAQEKGNRFFWQMTASFCLFCYYLAATT